MIAIILPCYNSGEHIKHAIKSIIDNTKYPYQLIIIESESTDGTDKVVDTWEKQFEQIKVFHTKKEGITKAINYGLKYAVEENFEGVYLTQDDVIIPKLYGRDWLDILVHIGKLEECGIATTISAGGISGPSYLEGFHWTGTWSMYIPMKTINRIGILDENFSPGPGDDIDYSYRVYISGFKTHVANFWVDHHRMTENFNDDITEVIERNAKYFRKKFRLDEIGRLKDEKH